MHSMGAIEFQSTSRFVPLVSPLLAIALLTTPGTLAAEEGGSNQARELDDTLGDAEPVDGKFYPLISRDFFRYQFGGWHEYDTELKRKQYRRSEEFKTQFAAMKETRASALKSLFYLELDDVRVPDFNVKTGRFDIVLSDNMYGSTLGHAPKSAGPCVFKNLRTRTRPMSFMGQRIGKLKQEFLPVPVTEEAALQIEENRNDVLIYVVFRPGPEKTVKYTLLQPPRTRHRSKAKKLMCHAKKLIIANKRTGQVYHRINFK